MKIIYVNCGWNMSEIWSSQCAFNLSSWKSNLKKVQAPVSQGHGFESRWYSYLSLSSNSQLIIYLGGLVAQWIEHCTGIARSWVRIPFKPEFFSGCFFFQLLKLIAHCEDQISLMFDPQFAYMIFIYSYSYLSLSSGKSRTQNWPSIHVAW